MTRAHGARRRMTTPRAAATVALAALLALATLAQAGTSLKLGAAFPGWDRLREGSLVTSAEELVEDYARQAGHSCFRPEVFLRDRSTSLWSALTFYESSLPYDSEETVLLEDRDQRVSLVTGPTSIDEVMVVHVALEDGVLMIVC